MWNREVKIRSEVIQKAEIRHERRYGFFEKNPREYGGLPQPLPLGEIQTNFTAAENPEHLLVREPSPLPSSAEALRLYSFLAEFFNHSHAAGSFLSHKTHFHILLGRRGYRFILRGVAGPLGVNDIGESGVSIPRYCFSRSSDHPVKVQGPAL